MKCDLSVHDANKWGLEFPTISDLANELAASKIDRHNADRLRRMEGDANSGLA